MAKNADRFSGCRLFLTSLIVRNKTEIDEINRKLDVYRKLDAILDKRSRGEKIPDSEYAELYRIECPQVSFLPLFAGDIPLGPDGAVMPDEDPMLSDCPGMKCVDCWKRYIDQLVNIINNSEISVKLPPEEP